MRHRSTASGQRVWKRQPGGGSSGLGRSPCSTMRSRERCASGVGDRRGGEQCLRVGVLGGGEQFGGRGLFDDLPEVHHGDPVGEEFDGGQVVGDEQAAEAPVALEVGEEVEHGRLDRDVERRGRLVGDEQVGVAGQGPGDRDALALAAGQLVRVPVGVLGAQPDLAQQLARPAPVRRAPRARCGAAASGSATIRPTVIRGSSEDGRVLEDQVEVLAQRAQGAPGEPGDVGAVDVDGAGGGVVEAYGAPPDGGLAAARTRRPGRRLHLVRPSATTPSTARTAPPPEAREVPVSRRSQHRSRVRAAPRGRWRPRGWSWVVLSGLLAVGRGAAGPRRVGVSGAAPVRRTRGTVPAGGRVCGSSDPDAVDLGAASQQGPAARALLVGAGQRGAKVQASGWLCRPGTRPGISGSRACRRPPLPGAPGAAPREQPLVYGCRGAANSSSTWACSTAARVHHENPVRGVRDHARGRG